eukprot:scaffold3746_cov319-Prasinococcus_capsulatus_cf.AAC.4
MYVASCRASASICDASSRVGLITSTHVAPAPWPSPRSRATKSSFSAGSRKASVLPVPVFALASTSLPAAAARHARARAHLGHELVAQHVADGRVERLAKGQLVEAPRAQGPDRGGARARVRIDHPSLRAAPVVVPRGVGRVMLGRLALGRVLAMRGAAAVTEAAVLEGGRRRDRVGVLRLGRRRRLLLLLLMDALLVIEAIVEVIRWLPPVRLRLRRLLLQGGELRRAGRAFAVAGVGGGGHSIVDTVAAAATLIAAPPPPPAGALPATGRSPRRVHPTPPTSAPPAAPACLPACLPAGRAASSVVVARHCVARPALMPLRVEKRRGGERALPRRVRAGRTGSGEGGERSGEARAGAARRRRRRQRRRPEAGEHGEERNESFAAAAAAAAGGGGG